ncbi:acyl-CoA dehydrogenase family protein [Sphingobium sp. DEHP117]|uniref:acyl-CoA dehydrogenase family protein n=1 Tax=Sphingobium sp. DEHP117 TaxID=2993436 RepID=UPI0027D5DCA8|nr:acyl-CoA dehydrogenase family protein [Sphingobium sp. DEHP117]MDQ4421561.1 acyl-CoA dehydrogenase family protein [Sphingobium sp. DEHP117]
MNEASTPIPAGLGASREELNSLRDVMRSFGQNEIRPNIQQLEKSGEFPRDIYRKLGELGAYGTMFPESMGGSGMGFEALAIVSEELAYAYPPLSAGMNLQAATVPLTIRNWGSQDQIDKYVAKLISAEILGCNAMTEPDGGTDFLGAMRTTAVREGDDYVIEGSKMWITNANVADIAVVYCKTDPKAAHKGVSAFLVPTDTPGFRASRVKCRALGNLMPTNGITFSNMRVPAEYMLGKEGEGFKVAMTAMDFGRLTVAARSLGLARACLDASLEYADIRTAFGQKIGSYQMIKHQLADMVVEVSAATELVYKAARMYDQGNIATRESSIAKYFAGEVCNRAAQATSEIFGGYAFSDELPISIYLNYAKLWQTGEGSANLQRILIADDALGWKSMDRHAQKVRNG